jgi:hypothetical protein
MEVSMRSSRSALFTAALLVPSLAHAGVTINELLPDPDGADAGKEWIELYNDSSASVSIAGWRIESGTSSYAVRHTFEAGVTIPARGFVVVGGVDVPFADVVATGLTLGNATSSTDAVRLVRGDGGVVDTVLYGTPNTPAWLDDTGAVGTSFAAMPGSGRTIGRSSDGLDTDQSGADFRVFTAPTPGASNGAPPAGCTLAAAADGVVINELLPDPEGPDAEKEWVEVYNGGAASVSLEGWELQSGTTTFGRAALLPAWTLSPGEFLVLGGNLVPETQVRMTGTLGNATSTSDAVRLRDCAGGVVDTVVYGNPNDPGWLDDTGAVATSMAPKPVAGVALARRVDGFDTDQSGADFQLQPVLTPGAPNPTPPPCNTGYLVINELLPDPPGADLGQEWIELFNPGDAPVDIGGWVIDANTSRFGGGNVLPAVSVPAKGFLVLGHVGLDIADVEVAFSLGNATSNSDGVQLRDCEGVVVDTVIYGSPNTDGWIDDTGEVATSLAPKAGAGVALARRADGFDTDLSGDDFVLEPAPTPGEANRFVEPVVCVPASGASVVLNELMVNPDGPDDGKEWIELYNPTGTPISVAGWGLSWATNADNIGRIQAVIPGGVEVSAEGFLLIGDELVDDVDVSLRLRLPNGTNGDGVMLFDCEGNRVDTVIYGPNNDDGITDDNGDVVDPYVRQVSSGAALARRSDGVDTDTAADWFSTNRPTPGASNNTGTGGGGGGDRGCSCGRRSSVSPLGAIVVLGLGGLLARRRRR